MAAASIWIAAFASVAAESPWQMMPYRVQCLVSAASMPQLDSSSLIGLCAELTAQAESVVGAPWVLSAAPASPDLRAAVLQGFDAVGLTRLPQHPTEFDKVMLVVIRFANPGFRVSTREFDVRTRRWGVVADRTVPTSGEIADAAFRTVLEAFAPLAIIENVDQGRARLWFRGSSLPVRDRQVALVRPGDMFEPFLRVANRQGETEKISAVPNTRFRMETMEGGEGVAAIDGGTEPALRGRATRLVEPLALVCKGKNAATADVVAVDPVIAEWQAAIATLHAELLQTVAMQEVLLAEAVRAKDNKQPAVLAAALADLERLKTKKWFDQAVADIRQKAGAKLSAAPEALQEPLAQVETLAAKHLDPNAMAKRFESVRLPPGK